MLTRWHGSGFTLRNEYMYDLNLEDITDVYRECFRVN